MFFGVSKYEWKFVLFCERRLIRYVICQYLSHSYHVLSGIQWVKTKSVWGYISYIVKFIDILRMPKHVNCKFYTHQICGEGEGQVSPSAMVLTWFDHVWPMAISTDSELCCQDTYSYLALQPRWSWHPLIPLWPHWNHGKGKYPNPNIVELFRLVNLYNFAQICCAPSMFLLVSTLRMFTNHCCWRGTEMESYTRWVCLKQGPEPPTPPPQKKNIFINMS